MAAISRPIQLQPTQHPAPVCADFEDCESVVAFEKAMRTHRAHAEPFELTPLDGRVDGAWRVSGASGAAYIVDIVDGGGLNDACSLALSRIPPGLLAKNRPPAGCGRLVR